MALVCDAEGPSGIAGIMGGQISEVSDKTTRVLMEAATWVGPNILRTSKALGLRTEARARFEKQLHPEQAIAAQRLAARLMVELCGARLVPGTIDVYPSPPRRGRCRCARRASRSCSASRSREDEPRAILERLGFDVPRRRGAGRGRPVLARRRRPARGRPDRGGRAHLRARQAADDAARARRGGRPAHREPARCAGGSRTRCATAACYEIVAWSFTSPEALERLRLGDVPLLRLVEPAERGPERDAAAAPARAARRRAPQRRARPRRRARCSSPRTCTGRPGRSSGARRARRAARTPAHERHHLGALLTEAAPAGWRTPPRRPTSSPPRGCSRRCSRRRGLARGSSRASARSCTRAARRRCSAGDERKLGWIGELHPLVAREWDLDGPVARSSWTSTLLAELAAGRGARYGDVTSFPAVIQDIAVVVRRGRARGRRRDGGARGRRRAARARCALFDVYHGEQVGEGNKSLALRLEFRAPDRTLTDEEVAERARARSRRELAELGGRLRA